MVKDLEGRVVLSEEQCKILCAKLPKIKVTDKTRETCKIDGCYGRRAALVAHARASAMREVDRIRPKTFFEEYLPTISRFVRYIIGGR